jgi:hypothetical protein
MARDFTVDDKELSKFIRELAGAHRRVASRSSKWIRRLTNYTHKKMRTFAGSRSPRSTGKLKSSITSKYSLTGQFIQGTVYVPSEIKYQFAAEEGVRSRYIIRGKPTMTFSVDAWKSGRRGLASVPHRGYYVFTQVRRGRYKGKHFTQRAFDSLNAYYAANEGRITEELGQALIFSRG